MALFCRSFTDVAATLRTNSVKGTQTKIQAICNGNAEPSAMQGFDRAREKLPAQEQWEAMEKQCEEQWKQGKNRAGGNHPVVAPEDGPWRCVRGAA
jgi:hypothetical protein